MTTPYRSTSKARQLQAEAREAAEVRDALTHPDVVALRVEKVRTFVDRLIWVGMVLGLLFTMTNVQQFTAHTEVFGPGSLGWWASWLLDPTVSVILLGVLFAERETSQHRVPIGDWARAAKWSLLTATYVMNTWESYAAGNIAGIVLHSVPPLAVFMGAEAVTDCNDALTRSVEVALTKATERAERKVKAEREKQAATGQATAPAFPTVGTAPAVGVAAAPAFRAVPNLTTGPVAGRPTIGPVEQPSPTHAVDPARPAVDPSNRPDPIDPGSPAIDPVSTQPTGPTQPGRDARPNPTRRPDPPARIDPERKRAPKPKTDEQLLTAARKLHADSGNQPTVYQLRQAFGIGASRATRLLAELDPIPAAEPSHNGAATRKDGA